MQHQITYSNSSPHTLLLYFTGWGTTPEVVTNLGLPQGWEQCSFWDYKDVSALYLPDIELSRYNSIYLVAWSMGVWAADLLAPHLPRISKAVAINGTPLPMHDLYGIPTPIFEKTLSGLDDDNRARFDRRMCGGKKLLAVYNSFSARSTEDLRSELTGVYEAVRALPDGSPPQLSWDLAYVSERDLIVPPSNQLRYWNKHNVTTEVLPGLGHYPIYEFHSWQELLKL
ncbi:MAG: alpha/beta fold hydrolase [Porphyromonas sp.]|nr:alpha/beta fold hydrolase [Porphyromonas sp.]